MPSHSDRIRKNYSDCFQRGRHSLIISNNSDIAPLIEEDGSRTTIKYCLDCGLKFTFNRPQAVFEEEMNKILEGTKQWLFPDLD